MMQVAVLWNLISKDFELVVGNSHSETDIGLSNFLADYDYPIFALVKQVRNVGVR